MVIDILFILAAQAAPLSGPDRLAALLSGSWTSEAQASEDPGYDVIHTRVAVLPDLTPDTPDDVWLYNESAYADRPSTPYRQTVTRLSPGSGGQVLAEAFRLSTPADFVGWTSDRAAPARDALISLEGCTAAFSIVGDGFVGSMERGACRNRYKEADFLDSQTAVTPDSLTTWDRGFKDDGTQVWGPVAGGYRFRRR